MKYTKKELRAYIRSEIKAQRALRSKADKEMKLIIRGKVSALTEILELV